MKIPQYITKLLSSQLRATFKPLNMKRPDLSWTASPGVRITYDYIDCFRPHVDIIALQGRASRWASVCLLLQTGA